MRPLFCCALLALLPLTAFAQDDQPIRVTVDNFNRAESDRYFSNLVNDGGFGKVHNERELADIDNQLVIRLNRDTLYSFVVLDLSKSPATLILPDAGKRYMAIQVINEDHYCPQVIYKPGPHLFTQEGVGTRYVLLAIRTFIDPNSPEDVKEVHQLQDALKVEQSTPGTFEIPNWDDASRTAVRKALLEVVAADGGVNSARMFGRKDEVDEVQHLLGTAAGWGGNPAYAALYEGHVPKDNDGKTAYELTVKDVPVDGFWSISVYDKEGYYQKNPLNAYTVNNVTAKPNSDGSYTIHFGGDEKASNYLPIMPGWNYLVRMYRPRKEILDGEWKFPEATQVK